jgi:hypothetical protein
MKLIAIGLMCGGTVETIATISTSWRWIGICMMLGAVAALLVDFLPAVSDMRRARRGN